MNSSHFIRELRRTYEKRLDFNRLAELLSLFRENAENAVKQNAVKQKYDDDHLPSDDPARLKFGLLSPMDFGTREVANTRILAWLMDPNASPAHGFGNAVLQEILTWCVNEKNQLPSQTTKLDLSRYAPNPDLVRAECWFMTKEGCARRADVFLRAPATKDGKTAWIIVIEAKIDAKESKDQCRDYDRWLKQEFKQPNVEIFRIFLSSDGKKPISTSSHSACNNWLSMSYLALAQILRRVWESKRTTSSKEEITYLSLYINSILFDIVNYEYKEFASKEYNPFAIIDYLGINPVENRHD